MKTYTQFDANPDEIVEELLHGGGAVLIKGLFSSVEIAAARRIIMTHSEDAADKATPLEEMPATLPLSFLDSASPELGPLPGFDYPFPEVFDDAPAINAEGRV